MALSWQASNYLCLTPHWLVLSNAGLTQLVRPCRPQFAYQENGGRCTDMFKSMWNKETGRRLANSFSRLEFKHLVVMELSPPKAV